MKRFLVAAFVLFAPTTLVHGAEGGNLRDQLQPFLTAYCVDCHGATDPAGALRLDTLGGDLADEALLTRWVRIHDKVDAGEMPPIDAKQPAPGEIEKFTQTLHDNLHAASLAHQRRQGRVRLRRLNSTEYENTIRELVGTQVRVKEMLPEESSVAGFDNVSAALDFSAKHLLTYQAAAEKAVLSAVPTSPPYPIKERRTGKELGNGPNFKQAIGRSCKIVDDSAYLFSKMQRYGLCQTASVRAAGTYRVRIKMGAVGDEKKPIPVGFFVLENNGPDAPVLFHCQDVPHGEPRVIERDVFLDFRQAFVVNLLTAWDIRTFKKPLDEYTGPGLRIDWLEIEGPLGEFPPPSYAKLFDDVPLKARSAAKAERLGNRLPDISRRNQPDSWRFDPLEPASADPKADAARLIRSFLPRAFRGPVAEELAQKYVAAAHQKLDDGYSFFDAMMYGYKAILSSPHFLVFAEPGRDSLADGETLQSPRLDDYAVADRLAYFLWTAPPDDELLSLAAKKELTKPEVLRAQVERMLAHPSAQRFTENFTGQWLDLRMINATIPDPRLYGDFDGVLLWSMPQESRLVFDEILRHDRSLLEFVDADWSILNDRLATLYGIPGVEGVEFRKVSLPEGCHRGGVLTQAAVLKVTADGTRTSPVLRGKWVLEKILGTPPAPPPPNVPAIEPDIRGATTIRQQLDKHREIASCASCHKHIDPPGFALEAFDPIGNYREFYRATSGDRKNLLTNLAFASAAGRGLFRGPDVEPGGETHDGQKFDDIDQLKKLLVRDADQLARNLTEKLLIYSTGADIQFADREIIEEIVGKLKTKNYGFRSLVHEVVQSRVFLNK